MSIVSQKPSFAVAVIMEKIAIESRWATHKWQPVGILPDDSTRTEPVVLSERPESTRVLFPGLELRIYPDEAEGYYLNVSAPEPKVFVMWRIPEDNPEAAVPHMVTLSYNEAARWMDAQEKVDGVNMPEEIEAALSAWVSSNYRPPEKKQRIRPRSFESKEGRYKSGMGS
jgi:hypothetical protein